MLRIEYFDKNRFMKQVAASRGSIILHLDNGTTCDLKKDREASAIFQTMDAPRRASASASATPLMLPASCAICSRLAAPAKQSSTILHYSSSQQSGTARSGICQSGPSRFVLF